MELSVSSPPPTAKYYALYNDYTTVNPKKKMSPAQEMAAYLGGSAIQTVGDNPVTAFRQYVQQFAKDTTGKTVSPREARIAAVHVFKTNPIGASLSGLGPRMVGVGFKRIPKFGFFLGYSFLTGEDEPSYTAATFASIFSAYAINPIRVIEKQQRAFMRETGKAKPTMEILAESSRQRFLPLQNGVTVLMLHSWASAVTGLVGQPQIKKYVHSKLGDSGVLGNFGCNLFASAAVAPIYVTITNPLSRLEVIMQTTKFGEPKKGLLAASREIAMDWKSFGLRGIFRGQGIGMAKAVMSLTLFHLGREWCTGGFQQYND